MLGDKIGIHMRLYMMYFMQRLIMNDGESAGSEGADEEGADEPGGVGDGDGIDVVPGACCIGKRFMDDGVDDLQMTAGGNLWDNTAIFGMDVDLGVDDI